MKPGFITTTLSQVAHVGRLFTWSSGIMCTSFLFLVVGLITHQMIAPPPAPRIILLRNIPLPEGLKGRRAPDALAPATSQFFDGFDFHLNPRAINQNISVVDALHPAHVLAKIAIGTLPVTASERASMDSMAQDDPDKVNILKGNRAEFGRDVGHVTYDDVNHKLYVVTQILQNGDDVDAGLYRLKSLGCQIAQISFRQWLYAWITKPGGTHGIFSHVLISEHEGLTRSGRARHDHHRYAGKL